MLRLQVFGGLVLVDEAGAEVATQHRRLALLALLAVAGARGLSRAKLQAYLWPEQSAESARHGLEQLLYYLRRQAGRDLFVGPDPLRLNPCVITSDVGDFEQALAAGAFAPAVDLHRGPFLDGFYLSAAPEFERWAEEERGSLATAYREALYRLAQLEESQGRPVAAAAWWRKLLIADPLSIRGTLGLMRALAAAGDRAGALRLARDHDELMQQEFGAPPSPEVGDLVTQICGSQTLRPTTTDAAAGYTTEWSPSPQQHAESGRAESGESIAPPRTPPGTRSRRLLALGAAAGILATIGAIASLGSHPRTAPALDSNLLAVAPFEVLDPKLELWREGLVDILSANLDGAGPLRTVAPTLVVRRWRGRIDRASTADLARRTGARLAVFGRLAALGKDSVHLRATLLDAGRADVLAELEVRGTEAGLDQLADSLSVAVLRELGRSRRVGAVRTASLGAASLPALKAYLQGEQFYRRWAADSALAYFQRAVALDSTFAMAMSRAGQLLWSRNDSLARAFAYRAGALNHGLPPRDSLLLASDSLLASTWFGGPLFDSAASDRHRRVLAILETAATRYPDDPEVWYQLGDAQYHLRLDAADSLQKALAAFDRAIGLDSSFGLPYAHAISIAGYLGDWLGARRRAEALLRKGLPGGDLGESSENVAVGARLISQLLGPLGRDTGSVDSLLRTAPTMSVWYAWDALQGMPDSAEVAVQAARVIFARRTERRPQLRLLSTLRGNSDRLLASSLGFRGYLLEAARILEFTESTYLPSLFAELSLEGGVRDDAARAVFDRWLHREPFWPGGGLIYALPWWSARGDTASLKQFGRAATALTPTPHARYSGSVVSTSAMPNLGDAPYALSAAHAYLALARHDSAGALRRFAALPLTTCPWCFLERLTYARLLTAKARNREALVMLGGGFPLVYSLPTRPVWELERARIAERTGDRQIAIDGYRLVTQAWRQADPVLQPYVAEAQAALQRLSPSARP
jgi:eukaryotic-like serine/threonine-protein kinase